MKIKLFMCAAIMFVSTISHAQYFRLGKVSEVKEIKSRPLILMLEEENASTAKKLSKKPNELAAYKEEIKRANEAMQAIVQKFWSFTDQPIVKTRSEVEKLKSQKNKTFGIISLDRVKVTNWAKDGNFRYQVDSKVIAMLNIDLIENLDEANPVYSINLPNVYPTNGDLALGVEMAQNFFQARLDGKKRNEISDEADENKSQLANRTLLIDEEDIKEKLTDKEIKESYPYPYKIVKYQEIEQAILDKNTQYAIVQIIPLSAGVPANAHIVMDTRDGKSLGYYAPIQMTNSLTGKNSEARISKRHLKNYTK